MAEQLNFKGNVKSVYTTNEDFVKVHFDKNGQLIKKETKYLLFDNYVYNEQGRLISYEVRVLSSGHIDYYHLQYDENGFLINDGHNNYKNDENGNSIEIEVAGIGTAMRKYNDKNQMVEEWRYYGEGQIIHSWGVDEDGNHWEKDEEILLEGERTLYEYNELGDIILRKDQFLGTTDIITYKYDKQGNWIERFQTAPYIGFFNTAYMFGERTIRIIEYY